MEVKSPCRSVDATQVFIRNLASIAWLASVQLNPLGDRSVIVDMISIIYTKLSVGEI